MWGCEMTRLRFVCTIGVSVVRVRVSVRVSVRISIRVRLGVKGKGKG